MDQASWASPDVGVHPWQVPHRPSLVVLSFLAALVLQRALPSESVAPGAAAGYRLQRFGGRQHRRRMAPCAVPQRPWALGCPCAACLDVPLRLLCCTCLPHQLHVIGMGCNRASEPGCRGTPGMVGQSLHHHLRYVSAQQQLVPSPALAVWRVRSGACSSPPIPAASCSWTHNYSILFTIAASAYLAALAIISCLPRDCERVESLA